MSTRLQQKINGHLSDDDKATSLLVVNASTHVHVQQLTLASLYVDVTADRIEDTGAIVSDPGWQANVAPVLHVAVKDVNSRSCHERHAAISVDINCRVADLDWHSLSGYDLRPEMQYFSILTV